MGVLSPSLLTPKSINTCKKPPSLGSGVASTAVGTPAGGPGREARAGGGLTCPVSLIKWASPGGSVLARQVLDGAEPVTVWRELPGSRQCLVLPRAQGH